MTNDNDDIRRARMEIAAATLLSRARRARVNRAEFFEFTWADRHGRPAKLADFHRLWLAALDRGQRTFIAAPRGHWKTGLLSAAMPLYELGRNNNLRIKLIAQSDGKAKERLFEIRQHLANNTLLKLVFPDLKLNPEAEESKSKITVMRSSRSKDASIEAVGVTSAATGSRADLMILDDVVDMKNSILQPQLKEAVKQKVLGEWIPTLEPDGRLWVVNTPWTTSDICAYLQSLPSFDVVPTPVGTDDDPFAPIWPEVWNRESLQKTYQEIGPVEYDRAYRLIALSQDAMPIQASWIKYYDAETLGDPWQLYCVQSYDLALSLGKRADYFAGVTLLYSEEKNLIFVVDAWRNRLSLQDQAKAVVESAAQWMPARVIVESGGYQGAFAQYLNEVAKVPLPVWPHKVRGSKARRLLDITPLFQDGRVLFKPDLNPQRNPTIGQRGDVIGELLGFPMGAHDDLCLAGSTQIRMANGAEKNLVSVQAGDLVSTRSGPRAVLSAKCTDLHAITRRLILADGTELIGTANHPVFIVGQTKPVRLDTVSEGIMVLVWKEPAAIANASSTSLNALVARPITVPRPAHERSGALPPKPVRRTIATHVRAWPAGLSFTGTNHKRRAHHAVVANCAVHAKAAKANALRSMVCTSTNTQAASTARQVLRMPHAASKRYIARSGSFTTGPYQRDTSFITVMATRTTMRSETSSVALLEHTRNTTQTGLVRRLPAMSTLPAFGHWQRRGTAPKKVGPCTAPMANLSPHKGRRVKATAKSANRVSFTETTGPNTSAAQSATQKIAMPKWGRPTPSPAASADAQCRPGSLRSELVPVCVVENSVGPVIAVYNLTVEGAHEYLANGILVHNCDALSQGVLAIRECFPSGARSGDNTGFDTGSGIQTRITML